VKVTADRLREVLHYAPESGVFTWRALPARKANRVRIGAAAGWVTNGGYVFIGIDGEKFGAHRLAMLYMTGAMPDEIDHLDGNPGNNRFANLRAVSHQANMQNMRRARKQSLSGVLGASLHRQTGTFRASIEVNGHRHHLGYHRTAEAAHAAYVEAKRRLHDGGTL